MTPATLHFRPAGPADAVALHRLAALDDAEPVHGDVLMAFADGEAVAAMSLSDGRVVADPFRRTADVAELLRLRAQSHDAGTSSLPRVGGLRPRLAA